MTFLTPRQRGLALVIGTLAVVSAAVAASGRPGWSLAVLSVLLGLVGALVLDVRGRQQVAARGRRRLEETVAALQVSVGREMTALTAEVRRAADRLSALEGVVRGEAHAAAGRHEETLQRLAALDHEPVTEVQALLQLVPKVPDAPPLPAVGGWALSAGSLLGLWRVVEQDRPATVVECGSGSSTLWLAYATRAAGGAQIVALEHRMLFLNRTRALLAEHGMADAAEIRYAPLTEVRVGEETVRWYDPACVADLTGIDLLLVDGPPKSTGPLARLPAVPLLWDRLSPGAAIVVDDAHRPDERAALERWTAEYDVRLERPLSRDAVLLRRGAHAD